MENRVEQLKALADRLVRIQQTVSEAEGKPISDNDFSKRFLRFSATTYSRIKNTEKPYAGNIDHITEQVQQAEEEVYERLSSVKQLADAERVFVSTKLACATQTAVKKARDGKGRRVVVLLAPTGAGKSAVGEALAARGATYIEGRQSWKNSYKAFCADVAKAAGRPLRTKHYNEHDAEARMLQALSAKDSVLYIDEANTLGAASANAIKLIVNVTGTVVVIAAIPEMWDKFTAGAEDEVAQLINRCQPILRYKGLSEADARPFLTGSGLSAADIDQSIKLVVEAANEFGAFKTIVALVDDLKKIDGPTSEDVSNYLKFHTKNIAQSGIKKGVAK